jgi:hypothetical protein
VFVGSAGGVGVGVNHAAHDGLFVCSTGSHWGCDFSLDRHNGLEVGNAEHGGVYVGSAGNEGVFVREAGDDGIYVGHAGDDGLNVCTTGDQTFCALDLAHHHGLEVGSAQHDGVYVDSAGDDGVHVAWAAGDGVYVNSAGDDGMHVYSADGDGVYVDSAAGMGVWVGSVDLDGVYVHSAAGDGVSVGSAGRDAVHVLSADGDGLKVDYAYGNGLRVDGAGLNGVQISDATWDGVQVQSAGRYGVQAYGGPAYGSYGFYTPDKIYTGGGCVGCTSMLIAQNGDEELLEPGDLVAVAGLTEPVNPDAVRPILIVRKAEASFGQGVIGVVEGHYVYEAVTRETAMEAPDGGHEEARFAQRVTETIREEPAAPGEYMSVVYRGLARVKVDAIASPIAVGDPLSVSSTTGHAMRAQHLAIEGAAAAGYSPGTVVGKAVEPLNEGQGFIWVLVDLQ